MARDDDRERIRATGLANGLRTGMQFTCQFAITARFAARNGGNGLPDTTLVQRTNQARLKSKFSFTIINIAQQLSAHLADKSIARPLCWCAGRQKVNAAQSNPLRTDAEYAKRNKEFCLIVHVAIIAEIKKREPKPPFFYTYSEIMLRLHFSLCVLAIFL